MLTLLSSKMIFNDVLPITVKHRRKWYKQKYMIYDLWWSLGQCQIGRNMNAGACMNCLWQSYGLWVGLRVGLCVGLNDGLWVGLKVGLNDGLWDGL